MRRDTTQSPPPPLLTIHRVYMQIFQEEVDPLAMDSGQESMWVQRETDMGNPKIQGRESEEITNSLAHIGQHVQNLTFNSLEITNISSY